MGCIANLTEALQNCSENRYPRSDMEPKHTENERREENLDTFKERVHKGQDTSITL